MAAQSYGPGRNPLLARAEPNCDLPVELLAAIPDTDHGVPDGDPL